ncbi:isoleucine--tRNA ligase [Rhabdothermincola salaria]|uniref:isoleucine--tRNA ligase n=1 Tax=Rhabdothermincola salaria TaxID=2903142 RepID=UPI001E4A83D6|nr:isoleucine--tRNA ligase [Rhabdothermincola salaria]MCD9622489.1 isoleucine--tRNA ligase [Rhabdothermincola salaria]
MAFGPVDPEFDLPSLEQRVLERWRAADVPGAARQLRKGNEPWVFYEGPPTANGRPGLHHVWARAFKDLYPRFQTMRGRDVPRKGGWDCHGLPVELEVEKELGLSTKDEIESFGIAEFNRRCRESVQRYVADWEALTDRAGVWIDTADAYWTLDNDYIESVWWLVRQLWDKSLLYEGHKVSPYCGRCGTALSSHELGQPDVYRDVVDPSVYVRFPLVDDDADLMVWTTTPWTLVSNTGAAVGPDIDYVRVRDTGGGRDLVMAAARAPEDAEVVARMSGTDLVGQRYQRPFDLLEPPPGADGWRVVPGDFVSTDDGSGIVHLAPAFGEDDAQVGRAEGLPVLNPVDASAAFDTSVAPWAGRFVKDADDDIIADLAERGLLVRRQDYEHSYPHCWRCSTPLIYWAKTSWFVRTSEQRDTLMRENEAITWHPEFIKHGRFGKWLEGNVDWALSRDRYWGTPLPIWRCDTCGHDHCIGSVAELSERQGRALDELDLHRPSIDDVTFPCTEQGCAGAMSRVTPVLDAWFDSGSMPAAQHHHPFADDGGFDRAFPADFICEAIDQTRGWFYSLLAVNGLVFDTTPYRNVVCLALIVDEHGQKMSKSRGNVISPFEIFDTLGADALRWYFFSAGQPWTPRRVFPDGIREATRQTLLTLWNVWSFFATYADLDGWSPPTDDTTPTADHVLDRWILSELDGTVATVTEALDGFDAFAAAGRLTAFVDDLSNWYLRRSRPRFWKASDPVAHATLHECLVTVSQLMAPFTPFLADELYTALTGAPSVHLSDWPADKGRRDDALAERMAAARRLVTLGRAARTDAEVKGRQPLSRAMLLHPGVELDDDVEAEIRSELNVKALERIDTLSGLMSWTVVPNFRTLGPRLGPRVNDVKAALAAADGSQLRTALDRDGWIEIAGERLEAGDVEVRAERHATLALVEDDGWAAALDLEIDDDLRAEGTARELVRALNNARKAAGLAIADRVRVTLDADPALQAVIDRHRDEIRAEVLAVALDVGAADRTTVEIDGRPIGVSLERVDA